MKDRCPYYYFKRTVSRSRVITGDRQPRKPDLEEKACCTHRATLHHPDTIGTPPATCDGDVTRCDVPEAER